MFCNNANKCDDLWDFYMYYNDCLGKLLEEVQKIHKYTLTRAQLDHVIWYTQK